MEKITDISQQKNNPKRVNVFLDGEFAFGISFDLRYVKKLEIGKNISEKQIQLIIRLDQIERLFNKALKFLSYRPRSEKEIRDHLLRKGRLIGIEKSEDEKEQYEKSVNLVIEKLKRVGQIDDNEFANWWVEQRKKFRIRGNRLIKMELLQKGVDKELIDEKLNRENKDEDLILAEKVALKKVVSYKRLDKNEFRIKMGQFLARRGFEWGVIKKVVDTLEKSR